MPGIVTRITRMLDNPDTTASEVGKEISQDQVLSAKVLKLVNSGFYGFSQPISTIPHAMVLLGFGVVKTVVMSTTVLDMMAQSMAGLWQHSLACARTCGVIARHLEMEELETVLQEALSGQSRLVMLSGEPGIGKTRTARELASHAEMRGFKLLWGRCYEEEGAPPYWPWVQVIRSYIRQCHGRAAHR